MKSKLTDVVIVGYGRSAVAKSGKKGALRETHPVDLGGLVLRGVLDKIENLPDEAIDDIIVGCAQQEIGQTFNIGRLVAQRAGLPDSVGGMSCNRFCSSGLQTIAIAAAEIQAGIADVIVAGGVESICNPVSANNKEPNSPEFARHPRIYSPGSAPLQNL